MELKKIFTFASILIAFILVFSACSATAATPAPTAMSRQEVTQPAMQEPSPSASASPTMTELPPFVPTFIASSNVAYLNGTGFVLGDDGKWRIAPEGYFGSEHSFPQGADIVVIYNDKHSRLDAFDAPQGVKKFFIIPAGNEEGGYPRLKYCLSDPCGSNGWEVIEKPMILNLSTSTEDHDDLGTPAPENEITLTALQHYHLSNWVTLAEDLHMCYAPNGTYYAEPQPCLRALPTSTSAPTAIPTDTPIPFDGMGYNLVMPEYLDQIGDLNGRITSQYNIIVVAGTGEVFTNDLVKAQQGISTPFGESIIILYNSCKDRYQAIKVPVGGTGKLLYKANDCKVYKGNNSLTAVNISALTQPLTDFQDDLVTLQRLYRDAKLCRLNPSSDEVALCRRPE